MAKPAKNTICLWYENDAEGAARFYAETFPERRYEVEWERQASNQTPTLNIDLVSYYENTAKSVLYRN